MTYTLIPNIWYTITPETDCDLATPNGISIHLPAGIQYFHFADCVSIDISGTATVTQNPPLFKPASASALGGGYIESNLNVGHGAAAAVAAQCVLTPGDLTTGGTLEDSNGQSVELENPHMYAEGYLVFRDATEACTLTIGEWSKTWEEKTDAKASGTFAVMGDEGTIGVANGGEVYPVQVPDDPTSVAGWNQSFTAAGCGIVCTAADQHGEIDVSVEAAEVGEDGNGIEIAVGSYEPVTLAGGSTARTKQDVVDALNGDADCPVHASLDADEEAISLTAKEYGVNDTISAEGDMFSNWSGMSGGHGDYTVAELVTAISGEFDDITPAAGEAEDTIVLTANTAGAAANAITYTATGCFGSGTVKQGSTTRGRNAVTQTAFKIYLNGEEFSGGGAPVTPAPEPLGTTTTLLHGHVYTVAADDAVDGTDLSALEVEPYATAELWIDYSAGSVTWPQLWSWGDNLVPDNLTAGTRYFVRVKSDGTAVIAELKYSYTHVNAN